MHLIEFILLQLNTELINTMNRKFTSSSYYIDLTNNPPFTYLGFVINGHTHSLYFFEIYRMKSFASEPSVMVYSFLAVGLLSLTYSIKFKIIGFIILVFTYLLVYSGVIHMSLLFGLIVYIYNFI